MAASQILQRLTQTSGLAPDLARIGGIDTPRAPYESLVGRSSRHAQPLADVGPRVALISHHHDNLCGLLIEEALQLGELLKGSDVELIRYSAFVVGLQDALHKAKVLLGACLLLLVCHALECEAYCFRLATVDCLSFSGGSSTPLCPFARLL